MPAKARPRLRDLSDVAPSGAPAAGQVPIWDAGLTRFVWGAPAPAAHKASHAQGGADALEAMDVGAYGSGEWMDGAVEVCPRRMIAASWSPSPATGQVRLSRFTAWRSLAVSRVITLTGGVAGVGGTVARKALYGYDPAAQTFTLLAETADDVANLWKAAFTEYERTFTTARGYPLSVGIMRGQQYALALLLNGHTTIPALGLAGGGVQGAATGSRSPFFSRYTTAGGFADFPASILLSATTAVGNTPWGAFLA